jgi:hypothetical protein
LDKNLAPSLADLCDNGLCCPSFGGKKLVIIIGQPKALAMAVKNKKAAKRLTRLAEWLS